MSFFSRMFGLAGAKPSDPRTIEADPVDYKSCVIIAAPMEEIDQWRVSGHIIKIVDGEKIERPFIRADLCTSRDEAIEVSIRKAKQIIDQNPRLFDNPNERGPC